jgi:dipeptidyl-peptidase-4
MFSTPDRILGIYKGKNTRLNVDSKMINFIETHLINNSNKN